MPTVAAPVVTPPGDALAESAAAADEEAAGLAAWYRVEPDGSLRLLRIEPVGVGPRADPET